MERTTRKRTTNNVTRNEVAWHQHADGGLGAIFTLQQGGAICDNCSTPGHPVEVDLTQALKPVRGYPLLAGVGVFWTESRNRPEPAQVEIVDGVPKPIRKRIRPKVPRVKADPTVRPIDMEKFVK